MVQATTDRKADAMKPDLITIALVATIVRVLLLATQHRGHRRVGIRLRVFVERPVEVSQQPYPAEG